MALKISAAVLEKLAHKHQVAKDEILECFANKEGGDLIDSRADHNTNPPTRWFIASTDFGRVLKVVFMRHENGDIVIKTAYPPNQEEIRIYRKYGI